ncbi:MAG: UDP-N-acetylmuramoyl-tripeptide--D-alanyl-D-alanine ligase [Cyclobacteriaceae bacterium]
MSAAIENLYDKFKKSGSVSTDTRQITRGSVFFALRGDKFNGNEFAHDALEKGAAYAVIDEASQARSDKYIVVDDALTSLQQLARYHRDQLSIPVIGLTGSNGKTTSKELVNAVLSSKYKVLATKGNLNNHIGVPLTVLSIDSSVEVAVIEMGANHVGEIASLCAIANPTHGFITNIGKAHIGTFGGFDNIVRGKSELYQHLINYNGVVWINSQDKILSNMAKRFASPMFYPAKGDYYHCEMVSSDPFLKLMTETGEEISSNLIGAYNFDNIAVALAIGKYFNVPADDAKGAIENYRPANMRSQVVNKGTNTIILDAYNANPSSMEVALRNLAQMKAKRKVAIVGDMYELEGESEKEHARIGELIKELRIEEGLLCGKLIQSALTSNSDLKYFEDKRQLTEYLKANPISDATILVKASRGMALETIVDVL